MWVHQMMSSTAKLRFLSGLPDESLLFGLQLKSVQEHPFLPEPEVFSNVVSNISGQVFLTPWGHTQHRLTDYQS